MMKICPRCEKTKNLSEFGRNKSLRDGISFYCRSCHNLICAATRKRQGAEGAAKKKRSLDCSKKEIREFILAQMLTGCVDCGMKDFRVLEFDHVRGEKKFCVGSASSRSISLQEVKEEIVKCDVRCRNCHKIRHSREANNWRHRLYVGSLEYESEQKLLSRSLFDEGLE